MALPEFTMRQLLEAGVHFGHQTQRWNPRMGQYIYGARNGIHIFDLTQTVPMLDAALNAVRETTAKGGRVLFVGTKRQAATPIAEAAEKCAQYYMNHRWLGGTLTNWQTISKSITRLKQIDEALEEGSDGLTKKERLGVERDQGKLQASLGGIREMGGVPDLVFVIDVRKEALAVAEANKLGIPVVAVVDTNCPPEGIDYMIPGNDDAARAIALYCDLVSRAALDGMSAQMGAAGVDIGAMEEAPIETVVEEVVVVEVAEEAPAEEAKAEEAPAEEAKVEEAPAEEEAKKPAKKTAAKKAPAKKTAKAPAKKAAAKDEPAKDEPAKKAPAKKAVAKKAAAKKAPAKKADAKKADATE
ncbi:SSU ribosomal protein S2p (SAe) [hydrothermal vent metagenome]|uniref:SSU ribosomal protein S2p (SAe) n=1 Tax=hydrothermal vent metagenome TaxID=652676 RepID=A0A3B0SM45_9ZZZZ